MNPPRFARLLLLITLGAPYCVFADTEGPARVHVKSSYLGDRYAKSIPVDERGSKGRTMVYRVKAGQDELEHTYDWYSGEVYLASTEKGTSIIRLSTGFRGHKPTTEDLAVGVYVQGQNA